MKDASRVDTPVATMSRSKIAALEDRATRAEATLHEFLESSQEATLIHRQSIVEYVNPALCKLTGYSPDDLIGKDGASLLVHPDDVAELAKTQQRSEAGESLAPSRARWRKKDGSVIWMEGTRTIVDYLGGPAVIVRVRDVTDEIAIVSKQEQAERSLRITNERFRVLFEGSPVAAWIWDAETLDILEANDAATTLYGYSAEEFLRLKLTDLRPPQQISALLENVAIARSQASWCAVLPHQKKDGSHLKVEVTAHGLAVEGHNAMLSMARDLTGIERMEGQLRQSQKMDAIGQLAGGIAHDFNNILAVILAVTDMMILDLENGHPFIDDLHEIESAARRASSLTHQLLAFSRQQPARPKHVLLDTAVSQMEKMLARTVRENITMTLRLSSSGVIYVDPSHVEQVLLNLVVNARDAMADGGNLLIETSDVELTDATAAPFGVKPGRYQQLSVSDSGCGMSAETQSRIFDPFFTTKEVGKGTGLGLATVFGIVTQSGGGIAVDSSLGRGTTFKVVLPQAGVRADSIPTRTRPQPKSPGSETILLVEDDENVRRVVSRVLRSNGYRVLEASNGNEALAQVESDGPVDILVSDLMMPHMDGRALGREIGLKFPMIKVLYMSGHELRTVSEGDPQIVKESFISKPFTPAEMLTTIRGLLERPA